MTLPSSTTSSKPIGKEEENSSLKSYAASGNGTNPTVASPPEVDQPLAEKIWLQENFSYALNGGGFIQLPPRVRSANNEKRNHTPSTIKTVETPLEGKLSQFSPPEIKMIRHTPLEPLYNSLIHHYHYLGYHQIVGAHLKYMAFIDDQIVACLGFCSPAWRISCRDQFIGWSDEIKAKNLHLIAQNNRFLILPYVKVPHLASKILSLNIKQIQEDWFKYYGHPIYLLETFVDQSRFKGTSYQASNWLLVGETKGFTKRGNISLYHGLIKDVYLYPLVKDLRRFLLGQ